MRSAPSTSRSGTCSGSSWACPSTSSSAARSAPSLPAYASWLYATEDLDALAAEAAGWAAQGFTAVKQRLPYGPLEGRSGIRRNVELVRTVADAVGPDVDVMADAYMSWDAGYAIRCIRAFEDAGLRLRWLEEPLVPDDIPGLARVRASVATPIAAGEHEATRYGFRDLVEAGAVDVLQPDVNRLGGITEARRVWALGETFGLDVIPHLGFAHNAHLAITSLATPLLEYMPPRRAPRRGGRGPDLLGRVPRRASRRGRARHPLGGSRPGGDARPLGARPGGLDGSRSRPSRSSAGYQSPTLPSR